VEVPNYFQYLLDVMTQPFFIFQYISSIIYVLENVGLFGAMMVLFGFLTTSINYVLLYKSYQKIKETAEKQYDVAVKRDGRMQVIKNVDLVCGDIYSPNG
jgi:magnesium-transporting ATPase (P-type)